MRSLCLQSWDRSYKICYLYDSGKLKWEVDETESADTCGFIKKCLFGGTLAVFCDNQDWCFQIGRDRWPLGDPKIGIVLQDKSFFTIIDIHVPNRKYKLVYTRVMGRIAECIDPTYDWIDKAGDDFSSWFHERIEEAKGIRAL